MIGIFLKEQSYMFCYRCRSNKIIITCINKPLVKVYCQVCLLSVITTMPLTEE